MCWCSCRKCGYILIGIGGASYTVQQEDAQKWVSWMLNVLCNKRLSHNPESWHCTTDLDRSHWARSARSCIRTNLSYQVLCQDRPAHSSRCTHFLKTITVQLCYVMSSADGHNGSRPRTVNSNNARLVAARQGEFRHFLGDFRCVKLWGAS